MKHLYSVLIFSWLCFACGSSNDSVQETATAPDTVLAPSAPPTLLSRFSTRAQQMISLDSGLVRGFTPGDVLDSVMRHETAVFHEDSIRYKGYFVGDSLSTDVLDIRYFFNPKSRITDSLVIDTYSEPDSLMKELSEYFTIRFGEPATKQKKTLAWKVGDNQLVVRDVSVELSPGLQVVAKKSKKK